MKVPQSLLQTQTYRQSSKMRTGSRECRLGRVWAKKVAQRYVTFYVDGGRDFDAKQVGGVGWDRERDG